jgi:hypothetical protein
MAYAAERCEIIKIEKASPSAGSRLEISRKTLSISAGSCTVWMNWVEKGEVQIVFRENAKACILATDSPSGFHEGELKAGELCYFTDPLPLGKTASLYWSKPGVYRYTVEMVGQQKNAPVTVKNPMAEGVIEVK